MYDEILNVLKDLARENQSEAKEIGLAIGLVKFCMDNGISTKDSSVVIPESSEAFGYFTISECTEVGAPIRTLNDNQGNPIEINPGSIIVDRKSV